MVVVIVWGDDRGGGGGWWVVFFWAGIWMGREVEARRVLWVPGEVAGGWRLAWVFGGEGSMGGWERVREAGE